MRRELALLAGAVMMVPAIAAAQTRPSTTAMSCVQAQRLVASRGAIVLGTGRYTYDRFVSDERFCQRDETIDPQWVPTVDVRQCFIGYRCKYRESEFFFGR